MLTLSPRIGQSEMKRMKQAEATPMLPLVIPSAPEEAGEEFPGLGRVRELALEEALQMLQGNSKEFPFSEAEVSRMLRKVRVIAWRSGEGARPALYMEDRTLAPYVRYFVRLEGESGIGRCPQCGNWFLQARPDQVFDSIQHREAHRVTRWRAGKKGLKKKSPSDTLFHLPRYNPRVTVLTTPPIHSAHSYSQNRRPCSGG